MTKDAKNSVVAFVSGMLVCVLLVALELGGIDIGGAYQKWFGLVVWTGIMFGLGGIAYGRRLRKARPLVVLIGLLVLHLVVFIAYLRSVDHLSGTTVLFWFPVEGGLIGLVMTTLGGVRLPRGYRLYARRVKWPPDRREREGRAGKNAQ